MPRKAQQCPLYVSSTRPGGNPRCRVSKLPLLLTSSLGRTRSLRLARLHPRRVDGSDQAGRISGWLTLRAEEAMKADRVRDGP